MAGASVVLHQFPFSHFNERARWGLDWKRVAHRRQNHLPGPGTAPGHHASRFPRMTAATLK